MFVPNNGTLFNPNPSAFPIERVCIGSDIPGCGFGAEDGTWIAVSNSTPHACVDISPPLVLNNGFCCISLDDCAFLDQPFLLARDGFSPTGVTVVEVFGTSSEAGLPYYVPVENNGLQLSFNPAAALLDRVCMLTMTTMSCGFGAEGGTWVQVYNDTDNGCSEVSPPAALSSITCCVDFDNCPALYDPFGLHDRDAAEASKPKPHASNWKTTLTLTSNDNGSQYMTVPADGSTFSFSATNAQISRVCVSNATMGCMFQAANGIAYAASNLGGSGCVNVDSTKDLHHGFCCEDFDNCRTFNLSGSSQEMEWSSRTLHSRGPIVNNTLRILFEGSPDLVGWEYVLTNMQGFNVTERVPWAVGQICLMSPTALCAFVGEDGTDTVVIGGQDSNCAVVAPPQVLIDGICCNSPSQCNASDQETIARIAGPAVLASIMGANVTNTTVDDSETTVAVRDASIDGDVTIQYWGAGDAYTFQLVTGDYSIFAPLATWGVDQVCIISPQGFCGFWSQDETLGFEVGPVAAGDSGACYAVGGAYILVGGICCQSSDGCNSGHSVEPFSIPDIAASDSAAAVTRHITFSGDPLIYTTDGGVTTVLQIVGDGHMEALPAFGGSVVKACVNNGGLCQFYQGETFTIGPSISGGHGGCLEFSPSIHLTGVACN